MARHFAILMIGAFRKVTLTGILNVFEIGLNVSPDKTLKIAQATLTVSLRKIDE